MFCLDVQALFNELLPLCRSISGSAYDQSLAILQRYIPFEIEEYPCGSQVFDWTVPQSWTLNRATLKDSQGNIVLDTNVNPLHVVNFSEPFTGKVSLEELQQHLYSDPNNPSAVPYVTSYYKKRWGFCLSHNQRLELCDEYYFVEIDTVKSDQGSVKVGVCELPGQSDRIVQLSSYLCHPNMMNNELSGPIGLVYLYQLLKAIPNRKYTYRFVINPETIGSICYLSRHAQELKEKLEYGLVLTCIAAPYNTATQNLDAIAHNIKPVNLNSPYFELVDSIAKSYDFNFLELPLSFKLTRQSMLDEFRAYFDKSKTNLESCNDLCACANKLEIKSVCVCTGEHAGEHETVHTAKHAGESESKSLNYVCSELFDKHLSDQHKLELYAQCKRAYDIMFCPNYHDLNRVVPYGTPIHHSFKYSYEIDNVLLGLASSCKDRITLRRFSPTSGSDERQYCSALLNLPIAQVTRTQYVCYPDYHSSNDSQKIFSLDSIVDSALGIFRCLQYIENREDKPCISVSCEPQLGKRGLYPDINSPKVRAARNSRINSLETLLTILNLCDGSFTVAKLARMAKVNPLSLLELIEHLYKAKLLTLHSANSHQSLGQRRKMQQFQLTFLGLIMEKSDFYDLVGEIFKVNPSDELNLLELDSYSSMTLMELIAQLEQQNIELDVVDAVDAANLLELYQIISKQQ